MVAVFVGRFQPPHVGHISTICHGIMAHGEIIVVLGGSRSARTIKNPFSEKEREEMIVRSLPAECSDKIKFVAVRDHKYSDTNWVSEVTNKVSLVSYSNELTLIGHKKDDSSYYLDMFPQWGFDPVEISGDVISATDIRDRYFDPECDYWWDGLHGGAIDFLRAWRGSEEFSRMQGEWLQHKEYTERWSSAPYAPTFITTDAVVIKSGHVLMVERKNSPGLGLLALPGGFLEPDLWLEDNAVKELQEETCIDVSESELRSSIKDAKVFDFPGRSLRGRTVTHAFLFRLGDRGPLPRVSGGDDAESARWVSIADIRNNEQMVFEDHLDIIDAFA